MSDIRFELVELHQRKEDIEEMLSGDISDEKRTDLHDELIDILKDIQSVLTRRVGT